MIWIDFVTQLPPQTTWQCRSLDQINIHQKLQSESSFSSAIHQYEASQTEGILGSLMPCTDYNVAVTFDNRDGRSSPISISAAGTTATTGKCGVKQSMSVIPLMSDGTRSQPAVAMLVRTEPKLVSFIRFAQWWYSPPPCPPLNLSTRPGRLILFEYKHLGVELS